MKRKKILPLVKTNLTKQIQAVDKKIDGVRNELRDEIMVVAHEVEGLRNEIGDVKEQVGGLRDDMNTKLDSIIGLMKKHDEEDTIIKYRQSNHGVRIEKLETSAFGKPSE